MASSSCDPSPADAPTPVPSSLRRANFWGILGVPGGDSDYGTLSAALAKRVRQIEAWSEFLRENPQYDLPAGACDRDGCLALRDHLEANVRPFLKGTKTSTTYLRAIAAMHEYGIDWDLSEPPSGEGILTAFITRFCEREKILMTQTASMTAGHADPKTARFVTYNPETCMYETFAIGCDVLAYKAIYSSHVSHKTSTLLDSCLGASNATKSRVIRNLPVVLEASPIVANGYAFENVVAAYDRKELVYYVRDERDLERFSEGCGQHVRVELLPSDPRKRVGIVAARAHDVPIRLKGHWVVANPEAGNFEEMGIAWVGEKTLLHRILDDQCVSAWQQLFTMGLLGRGMGRRKDALKTFLCLVGYSNTGKSTFVRILNDIMGVDDVASIETYPQDKYVLDATLDASAVVFLEASGLVKGSIDRDTLLKLAAQEPVMVNTKRKSSVQLKDHSLAKTLYLCSNADIPFAVDGGEFANRSHVLRFRVPIPAEKRDPKLHDKIRADRGDIFHACGTAYYHLLSIVGDRLPSDLYPESYKRDSYAASDPITAEEIGNYTREFLGEQFGSIVARSREKLRSMVHANGDSIVNRKSRFHAPNWTPDGDKLRTSARFPKMQLEDLVERFVGWLISKLRSMGYVNPNSKAISAGGRLRDQFADNDWLFCEHGLLCDREQIPLDGVHARVRDERAIAGKGNAPRSMRVVFVYGIDEPPAAFDW